MRNRRTAGWRGAHAPRHFEGLNPSSIQARDLYRWWPVMAEPGEYHEFQVSERIMGRAQSALRLPNTTLNTMGYETRGGGHFGREYFYANWWQLSTESTEPHLPFPMTIAVWMKLAGTSATGVVMCHNTDGHNGVRLQLISNMLYLVLGGVGSYGFSSLPLPGASEHDLPMFVACSITGDAGGTATAYVGFAERLLAQTVTVSGTMSGTPNRWGTGYQAGSTRGISLAEARVYSAALSPSEVWHQFNARTRFDLYAGRIALSHASIISEGSQSSTALSGSGVASATVAANLSTSIGLNATAAGATTTSGELSTAIALAADSAEASATTTANLNSAITLRADPLGNLQAAGELSTAIALSGSASATVTASGILATDDAIELRSNVAASATATAELDTSIALSCDANCNASASASLSTGIFFGGAANASALASAQLTTGVGIRGSADVLASVAAQLATAIPLSGTGFGIASTNARLAGTQGLGPIEAPGFVQVAAGYAIHQLTPKRAIHLN